MADDQITIATIGTPAVHEGTKGPGVIGTGNGKVVILETPEGQSNIKLNVIRPLIALLVGFAHQFGTTFLACLTAAGLGVGVGALVDVHAPLKDVVQGAAWVALISAGFDFIKNAVSILGEWRNKYPLLTGSLS
jgi:hypothetical protein